MRVVIHRLALAATGIAAAACSASDDIHAPHIASLTPDHAAPGVQVQIDGSWFCAQPEPEPGEEVDPLACAHVGAVSFATQDAVAAIYLDAEILVEVPAVAPGEVAVRVSVAGRMSNRVSFVVDP